MTVKVPKPVLLAFVVLFWIDTAHAIQWSKIYTAWPQNPEIVTNIRSFVNCTGPYALCAYSECKIVSLGSKTEPAIAECGCYAQPNPTGADAVNIGAVAGMLDKAAKAANQKVCGRGSAAQGNQTCSTANVAPVCAAQAKKPRPSLYKGLFDIISTYNSLTWPFAEPTPGSLCPFGQYTNCYSAGCYRRTAFNGANATCMCPVYNVRRSDNSLFLVAASNATCVGSKGFSVGSRVWNGAGLLKY